MSISTCQFCEKFNGQTGHNQPASVQYNGKVKYGVRHYAHFECFLAKKGQPGFEKLPAWMQRQFPYQLLKAYNLTPAQEVA